MTCLDSCPKSLVCFLWAAGFSDSIRTSLVDLKTDLTRAVKFWCNPGIAAALSKAMYLVTLLWTLLIPTWADATEGAATASAGLERLYGLWGSEARCTRKLIKPGGTRRFAPFDIRPDWLGHGDIWCRLKWRAVHGSSADLRASAFALCGEDIDRDYQIDFELDEDVLTIVWNFEFKNSSLRLCAAFAK